jgi:hypothetical protein
MASTRRRRVLFPSLAVALTVVLSVAPAARADHTPDPTLVTLPGSFQSELGCAGDWDPSCMATALAFDHDTETWIGNFTIPAGAWEYRVAINGSWAENYGAGGEQDGSNIPLAMPIESSVQGGPPVDFEVPEGDALVTFSWNASTLVPTVVVESLSPVIRSSWGQLKAIYR